jgi:hypothetical protein
MNLATFYEDSMVQNQNSKPNKVTAHPVKHYSLQCYSFKARMFRSARSEVIRKKFQ